MPIDAKQDEQEYKKRLEAVAQYQAGDLPDPNDAAAAVRPLTPMTAADCIKYIPKSYILDGLIEDETITLFAGKEKIGKTYVLMHMALSMAAERPWMDMQTMTDAKGKILWLDFDMNRNTTLRRMNEITNGIEEAWNVREPHLFDNFLMMDAESFREAGYSDKVQFFNESTAVQGLEEFIIANNVKVCFIDNLVEIEGDAEENSSNDIQKVFSGLKRLRDVTHASFILIHHTTKDGFRGRGSSAIFGETDLNLQLEPCTQQDQLILKTDGARNTAKKDIGMMKKFFHRLDDDGEILKDANGHYIYNFKLDRIDTNGLRVEESEEDKEARINEKNISVIRALFASGKTFDSKNKIYSATFEPDYEGEKFYSKQSANQSIDIAIGMGLITRTGGKYQKADQDDQEHLPLGDGVMGWDDTIEQDEKPEKKPQRRKKAQ